MKKTIDVAKSFQTSINISYDIHNKNKVSSLISTQAAIDVIEDILLSTDSNSTDRARILIGAYGKGKSHIILVALNILFNKDKKTFSSLLSKLKKQHNDLYNYMNNYLDSEKKLLPIIISGSSVDLTQSFLNAMQTALKNESLLDIMPETNFHSAIRTITQWKTDYPETYNNFSDLLDDTPDSFIASLANFEVSAYSYFVDIFPKLTSGSTFNPFVGLDVVELYEKVNDKLCDKGYNGMYIVYDEFSKYLESSISNATISDIKLLQDFAEKCVRSGRKQMHLLLITHKDISNYIDEKLPKEQVAGWRGVSGRFKHINVHNHFSQMYEIMSSVILKDRQFWSTFTKSNKEKFANLSTKVILTNAQQYEDNEYKEQLVYGCYPLHPISMFILPRVSEKVAQNERTLFTFLSSDSKNTLLSFLQNLTEDDLKTGFPLLTPDKIYDYFEQLFRKDNYNSRAFKTHKLTNTVLHEVEKDSLHSKIIKTLSLIYIIEQFEKLAPTRDVIISAFSDNYSIKVVDDAIQELINKNCIIYLKRSNGYLKIKESSGIDIRQEITKLSVKTKDILSYNNILNDLSFDNYMYPTAYHDEKDMVRYFDFAFMTYNEFSAIQDWNKKLNKSVADGLVLAIVPENENQINKIRQNLENGICSHNRVVTVLPRKFIDIQQIAYEYYAVDKLQKNAIDDEVLFD